MIVGMQADGAGFSVPDLAGEFYLLILNRIHKTLKPRTYFEVGTLHGSTLALSECASVAVDPDFQLHGDVVGKKPICLFFQMTSDAFFEKNDLKARLGAGVDFAFLDGLHFFEYLLRDFMNIEAHCQTNSIIAVHDCIPTDLYVARREPGSPTPWSSPPHPEWWAGDVWKVLLILMQHRPELKIYAFGSPPTGLVLITNLDPRNRSLERNYTKIINEWKDVELADYGIEKFHRDIEVLDTTLIGDSKSIFERFRGFASADFSRG